MKKLKHFKGFTLVELIIVITILSILATIAFISFQNFTKDARDGNRVSTIANIEKGLEMNFIKTGNYPIPDGEITQLLGTGGTLLSQKGIIGENITRLIKMNTTAIDPLINTNYVYAVNWDQKSYQIGSLQEGDIVSRLPIINQTYASTPYKALVKGTYKPGLVNVGGFTYMLPSLIFNIGETVEGEIENLPQQNIKKINISTIINPENKIFYVVNKDNNLPYQINNQTQINQKQTLELEYMQELKKKILENINKNKPAGQEITSEVLQTNLQELIVGIQSTQNILSQEITQTIQKITNTTTQTSTTQGTPSNCQPETIEDYNVGQTNNGSNFNAEKIVDITQGKQIYKQTFTCMNGSFSKTGTEEVLSPNCDENYIASGNTCVLDSCTGTPPDKSELNGTQGTASWSWSQTTSGVCKYKCMDGYETASCTAKTKAVTSATHNSRNYTFTSFTLAYGSGQTKESQPFTITNGTVKLTALFTLESDGTTVNLSGQVENVTCNAGFTNVSGACNDITTPTLGSFTINNNAESTNTRAVTLNITCPTDVSTPIQVAFGNTANPTNWTTCTSSIAHTLSEGNSEKTVYMRFRDSAITPNITSDVTKTITLSIPPCGGTMTIGQTSTVTAGGETYTTKCMNDGKIWTTQNMRHPVNNCLLTNRNSSNWPEWDNNFDEPYLKCAYWQTNNAYKSQGLFYQYNVAVDVCQTLGIGWRLPSDNDWYGLESKYTDTGKDCIQNREFSFIVGATNSNSCEGAGWNPGNKLGGVIQGVNGGAYSTSNHFWGTTRSQRWSSTRETTGNKYVIQRMLINNTDEYAKAKVGRIKSPLYYGSYIVCVKD